MCWTILKYTVYLLASLQALDVFSYWFVKRMWCFMSEVLDLPRDLLLYPMELLFPAEWSINAVSRYPSPIRLWLWAMIASRWRIVCYTHVTVLLLHEQQVFRHAHSHLRLIRLTPLSTHQPHFCSSHIVHQAALWSWHPLCSVSTSLQLVEHVKNEIEHWRPDFNARFAGCRKSVIGRNASIHYFLWCLLWCCFCLSMEF